MHPEMLELRLKELEGLCLTKREREKKHVEYVWETGAVILTSMFAN